MCEQRRCSVTIQSAQVLDHLKQNHALYFIDLREKYISE